MSNNAVDLFNSFATDTKAEEDGVKTQVPGLGDTMFRLARVGNSQYNRILDSLYRKNRSVLESKGAEAAKKSDEVMAQVYAKSILLGWDGEVLIKGKMTPYSYEAALLLCSLKDLREKFAAAANDFNTFKAVVDEEDAKN